MHLATKKLSWHSLLNLLLSHHLYLAIQVYCLSHYFQSIKNKYKAEKSKIITTLYKNQGKPEYYLERWLYLVKMLCRQSVFENYKSVCSLRIPAHSMYSLIHFFRQGWHHPLQTGGNWVPCPWIMKQFGCHTHCKIFLEVPYLNSNISSSNLNNIENWSWEKVGGASPPSPIHGPTTTFGHPLLPLECAYFLNGPKHSVLATRQIHNIA